jgi:hypothetical protein
MGDLIDELCRSLASGASRRATLTGLTAGMAAALPWTAAARKRRRKKKTEIDPRFAKYLAECRTWCKLRFNRKNEKKCIRRAKEGKGPCYAAGELGPGYVCHTQLACSLEADCCVAYAPPFDFECSGHCCPAPGHCAPINGTVANCTTVN